MTLLEFHGVLGGSILMEIPCLELVEDCLLTEEVVLQFWVGFLHFLEGYCFFFGVRYVLDMWWSGHYA